MARFDIFAFNGGHVMDLQNDFVVIPGSRVVAPAISTLNLPEPTRGLHPLLMINGEEYRLAIHLLAATPAAALIPVSATASFDPDEITRALDILFQGY